LSSDQNEPRNNRPERSTLCQKQLYNKKQDQCTGVGVPSLV